MSASDTKVQDLTPRNQYIASANQTKFDYDFLIFKSEDLNVYQGSTLLSEGSDYSVSGVGDENGGTVTLNSGASDGDVITLTRLTKIQRLTDFIQTGEFRSENINLELDTITKILQEKQLEIDRAATLSDTTEISSIELPDPEAGGIIGWNQNADGLKNVAKAFHSESVSLSAGTPQNINHNLNFVDVTVQFYDSNDEKAYLDRVKHVDKDNIEIEASVSVSGTIVVSI